jgi:hypothetical protein
MVEKEDGGWKATIASSPVICPASMDKDGQG